MKKDQITFFEKRKEAKRIKKINDHTSRMVENSHKGWNIFEASMKGFFLILGVIIIVFPFYWMFVVAMTGVEDYASAGYHGGLDFWPGLDLSNFGEAANTGGTTTYWGTFGLSFWVTTISTLIKLFVSAFAAYAFARFNFKHKETLFIFLLLTMMLPGQALLSGQFWVVSNLFDWQNTFQALIVPWVASAFTIFMLRNAFEQIPKSTYKAAEIDGCGPMKFFFRVAIPLTKPIIITSMLLSFIASWNALLWPMLVNPLKEWATLPVWVLRYTFDPQVRGSEVIQMSAAILTIIPMIILFLLFRKKIMAGVSRSGTKG